MRPASVIRNTEKSDDYHHLSAAHRDKLFSLVTQGPLLIIVYRIIYLVVDRFI